MRNVHIRYEDDISNPERMFSAGVTIKELSFQTTDSAWNPEFIDRTTGLQGIIHKLLKVQRVEAYWDSNCVRLAALPSHARLAAFQSLAGSQHTSILHPLSSSVKVVKCDALDLSRPEYDANAVCSGVRTCCSNSRCIRLLTTHCIRRLPPLHCIC